MCVCVCVCVCVCECEYVCVSVCVSVCVEGEYCSSAEMMVTLPSRDQMCSQM